MNSQTPEAKDPKPSDSYVQSFARGLEVIRSFSAATPQQTLSEVAAQTGLTRAGARRILLTLQTLGYVETDGKLFRLSPRILDLGFAYLSSLPIWNLAEPVMEDLVEEVRESSSAAVLDGLDIVYVLRVPTHKIMRTTLGVGSRLPACWTSMGRMLLAGFARRRTAGPAAGPPHAAFYRTHHHRCGCTAGPHPPGASAGLVPGEPGTGRGIDIDCCAADQPHGADGGGAQHQRPGQPHECGGDAGERCCPHC